MEMPLSRKQASAHLISLGYRITPRALSRMAEKDKGPPYILTEGRIASYNRLDLEEWARQNSQRKGKPVTRIGALAGAMGK